MKMYEGRFIMLEWDEDAYVNEDYILPITLPENPDRVFIHKGSILTKDDGMTVKDCVIFDPEPLTEEDISFILNELPHTGEYPIIKKYRNGDIVITSPITFAYKQKVYKSREIITRVMNNDRLYNEVRYRVR